ncbi:hypothetical protein I4U23_027916 [Adineta vaga]|nr:hypothetical protein I4U23_027916 [Adineta vaga]
MTTMENEYEFNYDQIKQIFESVPPSKPITKKPRTISYKTHFQPRSTKDSRSNRYPLITPNINEDSSRFLVKVQCFRVYQMIPIERVSLQADQNFNRMSNVAK